MSVHGVSVIHSAKISILPSDFCSVLSHKSLIFFKTSGKKNSEIILGFNFR